MIRTIGVEVSLESTMRKGETVCEHRTVNSDPFDVSIALRGVVACWEL